MAGAERVLFRGEKFEVGVGVFSTGRVLVRDRDLDCLEASHKFGVEWGEYGEVLFEDGLLQGTP